MPIKKWDFRGKKWVIGLEKFGVGNQTRRVKWCKMQALCLKIDKPQGVKSEKKRPFAYFSTNTFAKTEWKSGRDCKIKNKDFSF